VANEKRKNFLMAFLYGSLGLLLLISLIPTGSHSNLLGQLGAYLAFVFYGLLGLCAWVFVPVFFNLAALTTKGEWVDKPLSRFAGLFLGLVSLCAPLHYFLPNVPMREDAGWGGKLGEFFGDFLQHNLTSFGATVVCLLLFVLAAWLLEREAHLVKAGQLARTGFFAGLGLMGAWVKTTWVNMASRAKTVKARSQEKKVADEARRKLASEQKKISDATSSSKPALPSPPIPFLKPEEASDRENDGEVDEATSPSKPMPTTMPTINGAPKALYPKGTVASEEERAVADPKPQRLVREWNLPSIHLFKSPDAGSGVETTDDFESISRLLTETLANFNVEASVVGVNPGPTVTQYEIQLAAGVKINRIASLSDDLALALKCGQVRVVAPIPGKDTVGVEVPNTKGRIVTLKEMLVNESFTASPKKLWVALGKDITGNPNYCNLKEMPHLLVAGSTGSGKSVCVNTMIASLLMRSSPEQVRLLMIDPKRVELAVYHDLPHLILPVVKDPREAGFALRWLVKEMEERYARLAHIGVREIDAYNDRIAKKRESGDLSVLPMYYIVALVDELADLMITARDQVEDSITRLAQMARAVGIHLVLATQRPSVEVITGIIKANFPSRIAFQVFSKVDSRTILDTNGAEALLGRGDMLYLPSGAPKPLRLQGCYVSLEDIERLTDFWKKQGAPDYAVDLDDLAQGERKESEAYEDELFEEALTIIVQTQQASTSHLQRRLKVGYSRAARLLDEMERRGLVGPAIMNKPRDVMVKRMEDVPGLQAVTPGGFGSEGDDDAIS
jgi:S-DNA-T family DNA segregation ATPase FtsK/SpoIIIE